ncbi:DUF2785 domain-containing protein [Paenibacillus sp. OSY-SE]|uniref:DUF2785 domain-containing protein n=1 Tax=Paenibacillus sp. OSY-SE TaxID=1196323 RepID=UPI0002E59516|nr:DUF2785 domain-containing protein [Paenibacillus sp. OSY-SE]
MKSRNSIKNLLLQIKQEQYKVPKEISAFELALEMMTQIGTVDAELRDKLIYSTLCKWFENNEFTPEQMRSLLQISLSDSHLFCGIGETETDTVFTRSFSVLIVPLAVYAHKQSNYLTENEISYMKERLILYVELENDLRGYVTGKGWAHAIAHAADGLNSISTLPSLNHVDLLDILHIIQNKICIDKYLYINEEDERMVTVVKTIINREIIEEDICIEWINSLGLINKNGKFPEDDILKGNTKCLLRSLYFRLFDQSKFNKYTDAIIKSLSTL